MSHPLTRRATFWALCGSAITSCTLAWAQPRTVHLVVPYGSGAVQDTIARTFSQELGQALGATVVVENKPGAGGTVGTAQVAKSAPDGNTLVDRKSTRLNSSHVALSRMPSSA